jgi:hypothetical protein
VRQPRSGPCGVRATAARQSAAVTATGEPATCPNRWAPALGAADASPPTRALRILSSSAGRLCGAGIPAPPRPRGSAGRTAPLCGEWPYGLRLAASISFVPKMASACSGARAERQAVSGTGGTFRRCVGGCLTGTGLALTPPRRHHSFKPVVDLNSTGLFTPTDHSVSRRQPNAH